MVRKTIVYTALGKDFSNFEDAKEFELKKLMRDVKYYLRDLNLNKLDDDNYFLEFLDMVEDSITNYYEAKHSTEDNIEDDNDADPF